MISITEALVSLCPNAEFNVIGEVYSGIIWKSPNIRMPSEQEIENEITRLRIDFDRKKYQRQRITEYPSIGDQLDKLYHDIKSGNLETGTWIASIEAVKEKYPKPE